MGYRPDFVLQHVVDMKKPVYIPRSRAEHGGVLTFRRRKSKRALDVRRPVHIVLRSELAKGRRSLKKSEAIVEKVLHKFSKRFRIRIYQTAICGNHIHCLVRGYRKKDLQNFFRVFSGQVAQEILRKFPLQKHEKRAYRGGTHPKNQKTFWSLLLYSRVVGWGRDFGNVFRYIIQNTLETLGVIPYQERKSRFVRGRYPENSS
jgi:REP element-mobilizing transposase RayT